MRRGLPGSGHVVRDDGLVVMDYDRCIGCRYCEVACPYDARKFNWESATTPTPTSPTWGIAEVERRARGVVEKCTFCVHRIDAGLASGLMPGEDAEATPACVNICPVGARVFGRHELLRERHFPAPSPANPTFRLREDLGTRAERLLHPAKGGAVGHGDSHRHPPPQRALWLTPGMLGWLSFLGLALLVGLTAALIVFWHGPGRHEYDRQRAVGLVDHHRPVVHCTGRRRLHPLGGGVYLRPKALPVDRPAGGVCRFHRVHHLLC